MVSAGFKKRIVVIGIILLSLIMPAYAEDSVDNHPATSDIKWFPTTSEVIDNAPAAQEIKWFPTTTMSEEDSKTRIEAVKIDRLMYTNSSAYLETQWEVSNFTRNGSLIKFWITNYKASDIDLSNLIIKNHDTNESIRFTFSDKVTVDGDATESIWNLFGLLNPDTKISKNQTCEITFEGNHQNFDIINNNVITTRWG
ncbi:MAG: hypothetical protein PHG61_03950 [Candidatus Marinimicrobia bacterium]|nr:hypothetical protein [Candidatus Neomarinimicrobiota bacterium]